MNERPLIEVSEVSFAWVEGEPALRECSLAVARGEALGLLGRNGAGKTTLLRLLVGQIGAQAGRVAVFGLDPVRDGIPVRRRIGFVPEANELPGHLKASGVLALHRALFPSWDRALEARLLARFDLPQATRVSGLSKGQARQLALTCALAHRPELLLLDEPASGLDPAMRREFLEATLEFLDGETTVLFSSHHVQDVERLASRVVVIERGAVCLDAAADTLQEDHCVLRLPAGAEELAARLRADPACLRVRLRDGAAHALLRGRAGALRERFERQGLELADLRAASLEDLFVELVGRDA